MMIVSHLLPPGNGQSNVDHSSKHTDCRGCCDGYVIQVPSTIGPQVDMIVAATRDTQPTDWCVLRVALNGAIPWCWFIPKWHCICTSAPWCKGHQKVRVQGATVTKLNCHCGVCCFMLARVQICTLREDCTAQLMKWAVERWTPIDLLHCNLQRCASPLGLPNMQDAPVLNHHNMLHRTGSLQVGAAQWREFVVPFGNNLVTYAQMEIV